MKIAFIYPVYESLGIEYLSAYLKSQGHDTCLFIDPLLFRSYILDNKSLDRVINFKEILIDEVVKSNPDVICFSVVSDYYQWACSTAQRLKKKTKAKIILGGPHPTSVPEKVILNDFVDFVIVGEGEEALLELITNLENNKDCTRIRNVYTRYKGSIITNEIRPLISSLDTLPFPDKDLYFNYYRGFINEIYVIIGTRGCPNSCSYCYNNYLRKLYNGKNYLRWRSVNNVINELVTTKRKYSYKRIQFFDDLFTFDKEWLRDFCARYKKEVAMPFFCNVHPDTIDQETVILLEDAGCRTVDLGVQTISEELRRDVLGRVGSNKSIVNAINSISKSRIFLYVNLILGLPNQDNEELLNIARFFNKHKVDSISLFWLRHFPRTDIVKYLDKETIERIEDGYVSSPYSSRGTSFSIGMSKIGNLILLSQILPKKVLEFVIKKKLYRYLPSVNFHFINLFLTGLFKRTVSYKKYNYPHFSLINYLQYYYYFIIKWFKSIGFN